jgi:hypothetical protein
MGINEHESKSDIDHQSKGKMKTYTVHFSCQGGPMIEVQAKDEDSAINLAKDILGDMNGQDIVNEMADIIVDHVDEE